MLSKQALEEYKELYKKEFGEDITDAEADEQGSRLLELFNLIGRHIPEDDISNTKNSHKTLRKE